MVFADMFVRGARAERDAAQARAMAAEANVKQAEARAEAAEARAEAAHRRSDRLMVALIEILRDSEDGIDSDALQRLLDELR